MKKRSSYLVVFVALAIGATLAASSTFAQSVDTARIEAAGQNDWLTYHGSYKSYHYSPLAQINTNNVRNLAVAWIHIPGRSTRGLQSMPLVADGVLYYTGSYSRTFALNGATGEVIWSYFPELDEALIARQTHSPYNRGLALGEGKAYVGTMDGRLIALDMKTGKACLGHQAAGFAKADGRLHRGAALRQGHGNNRRTGRRVAGPRPDLRGRRRDWKEEVGVPDGCRHRRSHENLGQRFLAHRRRRRLDARHLRFRDQHVWWGTANPAPLYDWSGSDYKTGRASRRQPLHLLGNRARSRDRQAEVLSPGAAARCLGLRQRGRRVRDARSRRQEARRAPQQERLHLRLRPLRQGEERLADHREQQLRQEHRSQDRRIDRPPRLLGRQGRGAAVPVYFAAASASTRVPTIPRPASTTRLARNGA